MKTFLKRPFPVLPFLQGYPTDLLAEFMRSTLDPPFNARFAKFIESVDMTGTDFVRLSEADLARLCQGEGPYLPGLRTLQSLLIPPKSPHVREIFSLPALEIDEQLEDVLPDLFGPDANLVFDFPDEQDPESVYECLVPLPSTPPPIPALRLSLPDEDTSACDITPALEDDDESLIDMFSPISPSMGLAFDGDSSDDSHSTIVDIFDSPHLSSLCSLPTSPCYDEDVLGVDLLGLGFQIESHAAYMASQADKDQDLDFPEDGTAANDCEDLKSTLNTPTAAPPTFIEEFAQSPESAGLAVVLECTGEVEGIELTPEASLLMLEHDCDDIRPVTIEDESGLSGFMPDLRSLDSSPPFSPSGSYSPLSFVHPDVVSGGSLGLSLSPDLTIIRTPSTSFNDDVTIASPSSTYLNPTPSPRPVYHPDAVATKNLEGFSLPPLPETTTITPLPVETENVRPKITIAIPSLTSFFDDEDLSSLMSTVELTKAKSLASSRGGQLSSLAPPVSRSSSGYLRSLSRSSSAGQERSIWPLGSTSERYLPSPYMKVDKGPASKQFCEDWQPPNTVSAQAHQSPDTHHLTSNTIDAETLPSFRPHHEAPSQPPSPLSPRPPTPCHSIEATVTVDQVEERTPGVPTEPSLVEKEPTSTPASSSSPPPLQSILQSVNRK